MRVGMGYDVHKLTENRDLILGGVKIPWEKGLLGHSDADVHPRSSRIVFNILPMVCMLSAFDNVWQNYKTNSSST